jgi:hypothetical protein
MELFGDLLKILFFLVTSYLWWRLYKYSKKMDKKRAEMNAFSEEFNESNALESMEEGSDFFLVEQGLWCWVQNGEAVTTKDFHLSRGGAIEDYERYAEGKEVH